MNPGWSPAHVKVGFIWFVRPAGPPVMLGAAGAFGLIVKVRACPVPPPPLPALSIVRTYQEVETPLGKTVGQSEGLRATRYSVWPATCGTEATSR